MCEVSPSVPAHELTTDHLCVFLFSKRSLIKTKEPMSWMMKGVISMVPGSNSSCCDQETGYLNGSWYLIGHRIRIKIQVLRPSVVSDLHLSQKVKILALS